MSTNSTFPKMSIKVRIITVLLFSLAALAISGTHVAIPETALAQAGTVDVAARDDYFDPQTISVAPGTTVRWTNAGANLHTSTSHDGLWDSSALAPGAMFSFTFNTPGTYAYHCTYHAAAGMRGQVIVTQEGTATPTVQPGPSPTPAGPGPAGNLALGKRVAASSAQAGRPPTHAVDGNIATFWASLPAGYGSLGAMDGAPSAGQGGAIVSDDSRLLGSQALVDLGNQVRFGTGSEGWSPKPLTLAPNGGPDQVRPADGLAPEFSEPAIGEAQRPGDAATGASPLGDEDAGALFSPDSLNEPMRHNYEWIQVDLGADYAVNRLQMMWTASNYATGYSVYVYRQQCGGWCHLGSTTRGDGNDTLTLGSSIQGRYFLLWLVYPARPYGPYELREWSIFGSEQPGPSGNVAQGRPAVASDALAGHPPAYAFDGNVNTDWQSTGLPAWIYVDLGVNITVRQATLRWTPGMHATHYGVYGWNGSAWTGLYGTYSGNGGDDNVALTPMSTRYVALYAASGPAGRVGLREFEVYASATQPYPLSDDLSVVGPAGGDTGLVEKASRFDWRLAPESLRMPDPSQQD